MNSGTIQVDSLEKGGTTEVDLFQNVIERQVIKTIYGQISFMLVLYL